MYFISVKVRQNDSVNNKSVFLALGINSEGQKVLLGMQLDENKGAKFWLNVLTELKKPGPSGHPVSLRGRPKERPGCDKQRLSAAPCSVVH